MRPDQCFLCGSANTLVLPYLRLNSRSLSRNLAYALPVSVGRAFAALSKRFRSAYATVAVNKTYFDRQAVFCRDCRTGACQPFFTREQLDQYYHAFYWENRAQLEGRHVPQDDRPNPRQLDWAQDRLAWITRHIPLQGTVMDFGAGDCAAGYVLEQQGLAVHVVDPSADSERLAHKYGLAYSSALEDAPAVDLVYSAQSIEHVHDLVPAFQDLMDRVKPGGHAFFETPNVADPDVFRHLVLTPHTFMLSTQTMQALAGRVGATVVAMETVGPAWSRSHARITSPERTDVRVLLRKDGAG